MHISAFSSTGASFTPVDKSSAFVVTMWRQARLYVQGDGAAFAG